MESAKYNIINVDRIFGNHNRVEHTGRALDGLMTDESWHSDILLLWVAEEDRADREDELVPRYTVELAGGEGTDEACTLVRRWIEADLTFRQKVVDRMQ